MRFRILSSLCLYLLVATNSFSQDHDHEDHHHESHDHVHEIGIANAPVYFVNEEEFAYGLHLHYVYTLPDSKFGLGLGYERIFDDHGHNTIGVVASYRPITELVFNLSPGITYEDEEPDTKNFALHFEVNYEWRFHDLHIGPVFEVAYDPEDIHISLGLHLGFGL